MGIAVVAGIAEEIYELRLVYKAELHSIGIIGALALEIDYTYCRAINLAFGE